MSAQTETSSLAPAVPKTCLNCGAALAGPHCHQCGQAEDAPHRSIRRLVLEAFEAVTDLDGRFLTTLRRLAWRPAGLTLDYLAGKRRAQVSPFQLFILALALLLLQSSGNVTINPSGGLLPSGLPPWVTYLARYLENPRFLAGLQDSARLFALLTAPVAALVLRGIFPLRRSVTLYDHIIFALHSLTFQMLMLSLILLIPDPLGALALLPLAAMPAHLFVHMRGVYATSTAGTLARMALLGIGTSFAYGLLAILWFALAAALAAI
jgi:hypothetical protein